MSYTGNTSGLTIPQLQQLLKLGSTAANTFGGQGSGTPLASAGNAAGIVGGLQQGGIRGDVSAAANAGQLTGNLSGNTSLNSGAGDLVNALGIYNGVQRGGVLGYGGAAANSAQLAGNLLSNPALSSIGGDIAAPLAVYNAVNNYQSGATGSDALQGAEAGASVGSIIPGVGTIVGGLVGGAVGAIASAFGSGEKDPETSTWDQYTQAYNKSGAQGVAGDTDPYLALAGLFDLRGGQIKGNIPIYQEFGRMGEGKFTDEMTSQINDALAKGEISKSSTPQQIMNQVVDPWIGSFGKGQMSDSNQNAINNILTQMVGQYETGQAQQDWKAVGGDAPFSNLAAFGSPVQNAQTSTPATPQSALEKSRGEMIGGPYTQRPVMQSKEGGSVNKHSKVLQDILSAPSFSKRVQHYDDGGYVSYSNDGVAASYPAANIPDPTLQQMDYTGTAADPNLSDQGLLSALGMTSDSGSSSSGSGILGNLGNLLSNPTTLAALIGGGLGLAGAVGSKNGASNMTANYNPSAPTPFVGSGPNASNVYGNFTSAPRTRLNPTNINYATAGQSPTPGGNYFYGQSALQSNASPTAAPSTSGMTLQQLLGLLGGSGGVATAGQGMTTGNGAGTLRGVAQGGEIQGMSGLHPSEGSRHVRGPGDGTSDDINAKLSNGEYVMDANTVALLGNGSNDAGAKKLDQLRERLRLHASQPMKEGKQFMKAKDPAEYMKGGSK